ncbi:MAG: hypothetical protein R3286_00655 [Gammaproteobacteria bacterium]|nr:hypothetical protein [Gammaproteobacteria bacterium]
MTRGGRLASFGLIHALLYLSPEPLRADDIVRLPRVARPEHV